MVKNITQTKYGNMVNRREDFRWFFGNKDIPNCCFLWFRLRTQMSWLSVNVYSKILLCYFPFDTFLVIRWFLLKINLNRSDTVCEGTRQLSLCNLLIQWLFSDFQINLIFFLSLISFSLVFLVFSNNFFCIFWFN